MSLEVIARQRFLEEYRYIRHAEGRGSESSEYYCALPACAPEDRNAAMWAMRAKTYGYFAKNVLAPLETKAHGPLRILDLGAGNCWLSNRLSSRGHDAVAIDIFTDERDGLRAARHYPKLIPAIEADFDSLPLQTGAFDLVIFNAALHYSVDFFRTLREAQRVLRPGGSLAILDSPVYRRREDGLRMVEEKHREFLNRYGFASDALPSIEFLDLPMLRLLSHGLGLHWRVLRPWYGWRWHLRPLRAGLRGHRPPSRFWILLGACRHR